MGFTGIDGQILEWVSYGSLCTLVSRTASSELVPSINRIMTYQRVVEFLYTDRAVVPMRFGCLFPNEEDIRKYLAKHDQYYLTLLDELEGCAEMGIRILIRSEHFYNQTYRDHSIKTEESGRAYLAARKDHYARACGLENEYKRVIEKYKASFSGLFVKCKVETPLTANPLSALNTRSSISEPMISLYFLVRKNVIESFRHTFRHIKDNDSLKHLLSGPWPPYNFVIPDSRRNFEDF
jgi:hypothetical protein